VAWWNFCLVHNYAARFYHFTIQTIRETQLEMHRKFLSDIETIESSSTSGDEGGLVDQLTEFTVAQGDYAQQRWKELFFHLIVSFRDGYVITGQDTPSVTLTNSASPPSSHPLLPSPHLPLSSLSVFYPRWWLEAAGYFETSPNHDPNAILFAPSPSQETNPLTAVALLPLALTALVCLSVGYLVGGGGKRGDKRGEYTVIRDDISSNL
jgi:hypothetical protein